MPKLLAPKTVNAIRQYIDEGIPLEDLDMSNVNRERVRICEQVYERLQQDPMLDINRCLMRTFGRSKEQVAMDKQVIEMFVETLEGMSKAMWLYRIGKMTEKEYRIAEQTGDWKPLDKAISHMEKIVADMGDDHEDVVKNTAALPAVLVGVSVVDPSKQELDDHQFVALLKKYDGKQDQIDEMIHERREAILLERRSTDDDAQTTGYMQEVSPQMQIYQEQEASYKARIAELEAQLRKAQGKETKQDVLDMLNEMMDND